MSAQLQQIEPSTTCCRIRPVQSSELDCFWHQCAPIISRALEEAPEIEIDEVYELVKSRDAQLWLFYAGELEGAWITKVLSTKTCTWGLVWLCAGNFVPYETEALDLYRLNIERWMASLGCRFVEIHGRKGWARIFKDYQQSRVVIRKILCP